MACRIAGLRELFDLRPSGIGKVKQPGDFIKCFSCGVIARFAEPAPF